MVVHCTPTEKNIKKKIKMQNKRTPENNAA